MLGSSWGADSQEPVAREPQRWVGPGQGQPERPSGVNELTQEAHAGRRRQPSQAPMDYGAGSATHHGFCPTWLGGPSES